MFANNKIAQLNNLFVENLTYQVIVYPIAKVDNPCLRNLKYTLLNDLYRMYDGINKSTTLCSRRPECYLKDKFKLETAFLHHIYNHEPKEERIHLSTLSIGCPGPRYPMPSPGCLSMPSWTASIVAASMRHGNIHHPVRWSADQCKAQFLARAGTPILATILLNNSVGEPGVTTNSGEAHPCASSGHDLSSRLKESSLLRLLTDVSDMRNASLVKSSLSSFRCCCHFGPMHRGPLSIRLAPSRKVSHTLCASFDRADFVRRPCCLEVTIVLEIFLTE